MQLPGGGQGQEPGGEAAHDQRQQDEQGSVQPGLAHGRIHAGRGQAERHGADRLAFDLDGFPQVERVVTGRQGKTVGLVDPRREAFAQPVRQRGAEDIAARIGDFAIRHIGLAFHLLDDFRQGAQVFSQHGIGGGHGGHGDQGAAPVQEFKLDAVRLLMDRGGGEDAHQDHAPAPPTGSGESAASGTRLCVMARCPRAARQDRGRHDTHSSPTFSYSRSLAATNPWGSAMPPRMA